MKITELLDKRAGGSPNPGNEAKLIKAIAKLVIKLAKVPKMAGVTIDDVVDEIHWEFDAGSTFHPSNEKIKDIVADENKYKYAETLTFSVSFRYGIRHVVEWLKEKNVPHGVDGEDEDSEDEDDEVTVTDIKMFIQKLTEAGFYK